MLKTTLILIFALLSLVITNAQKIDMAQIKQQVSDSAGTSIYSNLTERFNNFDTTLNLNEYRLLYYGFVYQKDYSPYGGDGKTEINTALKSNDYALVSTICDDVLRKTPISLTANYWKGYALFKQNETDSNFKKYRSRYWALVDGIVSSGDGESCETAFKTIFVSDEYFIMQNHLNVEKYTTQKLVGICDVFTISPSKEFDKTSLYFDTSETLMYLNRMMGDGDKTPNENRKKRKQKKND